MSGAPRARDLAISDDGRMATGIWECTPGTYRSEKRGVSEFMHVVRGEATITGDDGVVHELRAGHALLLPDGWSGTWEIRETVRKTYVVVTTA
jgi:uncharacterized cupin superfamily protein